MLQSSTNLKLIDSLAQIILTLSPEERQLLDQNDVKILATAIAAQAEVLITGDLDLLILHPFGAVRILTPGDFQQIVKEQLEALGEDLLDFIGLADLENWLAHTP